MLGERLPIPRETAPVSIVRIGTLVRRAVNGERLRFRLTGPAEAVLVATAVRSDEIDSAGTRLPCLLPFFFEWVPLPCTGLLFRIEELRCIADGNAAEFFPRGLRFACSRSFVLRDVAPKELHVVVVAVADVAGDVEILPADVRRRIEQIHEVAAADDGTDNGGFLHDDFAQSARAGIGELLKFLAGFGEFVLCVRQEQFAFRVWLDVHPENFRVWKLRAAVAAAHALHERRPRREFGNEQPRRDIHASLDGLRGDDDAVAGSEKKRLVLRSVFLAEARVDEGDALRGARLLPFLFPVVSASKISLARDTRFTMTSVSVPDGCGFSRSARWRLVTSSASRFA